MKAQCDHCDTAVLLTGRARDERWGWEMRGESRWERTPRATDLGELSTNFRINLSMAEADESRKAVEVRVERKR